MAYKRAQSWQDLASIARGTSATPGYGEENGHVAKRRALVPADSQGRHVTFDGTASVEQRLEKIRHNVANNHTAHSDQRNRYSIAHEGQGRVSVTSARWRTKLFNGLYAAVVTPLNADGSVAPQLVEPYARQLQADGVNGVFVTGTAGMSMSLSVRERKALVEAWCAAGLRHDLEVLAHIGAQSLEESKELAAHAEEAGVLAVSCMAPSFFKPSSPKELAKYCKDVADAAPYTPFLYYHFPEITGVPISMTAAMQEMHGMIPTLRGGKFTSKDMWDLGDCLDLGKSLGVEWDLMMGYEGQTTSALPLGITAHIGIGFSVLGPVWNRLVRAFDSGRLDEASKWQEVGRRWFRMFANISGLWSMTAVTKILLAERIGGGLDFGPMRLPQKPLTDAEYVTLRSIKAHTHIHTPPQDTLASYRLGGLPEGAP